MHSHVTCQMTKSGFISLCCYKETVEHLEHMCFLIFCTRGILHLISVTSFIARFYSICLFEGSSLCQYSYPGLQFKQEISRSLPLLATLYLKCPYVPWLAHPLGVLSHWTRQGLVVGIKEYLHALLLHNSSNNPQQS